MFLNLAMSKMVGNFFTNFKRFPEKQNTDLCNLFWLYLQCIRIFSTSLIKNVGIQQVCKLIMSKLKFRRQEGGLTEGLPQQHSVQKRVGALWHLITAPFNTAAEGAPPHMRLEFNMAYWIKSFATTRSPKIPCYFPILNT